MLSATLSVNAIFLIGMSSNPAKMSVVLLVDFQIQVDRAWRFQNSGEWEQAFVTPKGHSDDTWSFLPKVWSREVVKKSVANFVIGIASIFIPIPFRYFSRRLYQCSARSLSLSWLVGIS